MSVLTPQNGANFLTSVVNQAIISPLGDPYTIGISGLIFDIVGDVGVKASSNITDNFVEQNYSIQDHWAQKPLIVTMRGYAAEQVSVFTPNVIQQIFAAVSGLVPLSGLGPNFNLQDLEFYNSLNSVAQLGQNVINSVSSIFQLFNQAATLITRQQSVFQFLLNMWQTRQLATVETPYAVYQNMAIDDLDAVQTEETTLVSEFTIRFKQIMTVSSISATNNVNSTTTQNTGTTSNTTPVFGGAAAPLSLPTTNLGNDQGLDSDVNGNNYSVASVSQSTYLQQITLPNIY